VTSPRLYAVTFNWNDEDRAQRSIFCVASSLASVKRLHPDADDVHCILSAPALRDLTAGWFNRVERARALSASEVHEIAALMAMWNVEPAATVH